MVERSAAQDVLSTVAVFGFAWGIASMILYLVLNPLMGIAGVAWPRDHAREMGRLRAELTELDGAVAALQEAVRTSSMPQPDPYARRLAVVGERRGAVVKALAAKAELEPLSPGAAWALKGFVIAAPVGVMLAWLLASWLRDRREEARAKARAKEPPRLQLVPLYITPPPELWAPPPEKAKAPPPHCSPIFLGEARPGRASPPVRKEPPVPFARPEDVIEELPFTQPRGPAGLTRHAWDRSADVRDLLRFVVPRIPREHLTLVLCALAERAWPAWHADQPDDWRPAWAIATARAWCFGEVTPGEVLDAALAAQMAVMRGRGVAKAAAWAAALVAAYVEWPDPEDRSAEHALELVRHLRLTKPSAEDEAVFLAIQISNEDSDPRVRAYSIFAEPERDRDDQPTLMPLDPDWADLVRTIVPYPLEEPSDRWVVGRWTVRVDGALLQRQGWRITGWDPRRKDSEDALDA